MADPIRFSGAAERNQEPILAMLRDILPASGLVLEIASGTGQHAAAFAAALPNLRWQPSDPDEGARASIAARAAQAGLENLLEPLALNVEKHTWPIESAEAVYCANMIHISPWSAALALLDGAERILAAGAPLILYGPYLRHGVPTSPGNLAFDADLKRRNPAWGIRNLEAVTKVAAIAGFVEQSVHPMPANNLLVVYRRAG